MQMCENKRELDFIAIQQELQLDSEKVEEFIIEGNYFFYSSHFEQNLNSTTSTTFNTLRIDE